jgi:O-antigen/teichoic acid export membrane protein
VSQNAGVTAAGSAEREAKRAGRGFLFITAAKLYFMLAGAAIEFALPHLFPAATRAQQFALYKVVVSIVSVINNVIVTVTIQSVSKFVAEEDQRQGQVARAGLRLMVPLGIGVAAVYAALAGVIAGFEKDDRLVPYLRVSALIVLAYATYSVFVGIANGRREFHKQAGLDMTFSTLRAASVLSLAAGGFGVFGAVGGFAGAALAMIGVSASVVRLPPASDGERFASSRLLGFFGPVGLYTLLLTTLLSVGLLLVKRYTPADSPVPGYYAAAQTLSVLSYQAIIAMIFVVFPLMSRAVFEGDRDRARNYVGRSMRYGLILAAAFGVVLAAKPAAIMRVPYPAEFGAGGPALALLGLAYVAFSLLAMAGAILNGAGYTLWACLTVAMALVLTVATNLVLLPGAPDPLRAAAIATTIGMGVGLAITAGTLWRLFGVFIPGMTAVRVTAAIVAGIAVGHVLPDRGKMFTVVECGVVGVTYLAVLFASREVTVAELKNMRKVVGGKS